MNDILKSTDKKLTKDLELEFMDDVDKTIMYGLIGLEVLCDIACFRGFKQLLKNAGVSGFSRSVIALGMTYKMTRAFNFAGAWAASAKRRAKKEEENNEE